MVKVGKKVALVHDFLTVFAGGERVLLALHKLFPEAPIYTMFADPTLVQRFFPKAEIHTSPLQKSLLKKRPWLLLTRMPKAVESYDLSQYDLVISSSGAFSHGVITGPATTHISYCHSPMRYAWDWHAEYLREKGITSAFAQFFANTTLNRLRLWDAVSAKRVDHWLANSKTVATRIATFYKAPSTVVYPPVDTTFFDPSLIKKPTKKSYYLSVCRLSKNKRVDQMIRAVAATGDTPWVGGDGAEYDRLQALASELKAKVHFLGKLSETDKRTALAGAKAFLFAAEDDFGIAPVEALAMGTPVIALGKGGACETVENGKTGILYDYATPEALASALKQFDAKGVTANPATIRASTLRFSTEHFNQSILEVISHA